MAMEADRMVNLDLADEHVYPERDVILEERRSRVDNEPSALLGEQLMAAQYLHHPYRLPVIGWFHEIAGYTREDALDFYRQWYAPNNAVLVVAGDVTAAELRPLAETHLRRRSRPAPVPPRRPSGRAAAACRAAGRPAPRARAAAEPDALLPGAELQLAGPRARLRAGACWPRSWAAAAPAGCSARWWSSRALAAGAGRLLPRHQPRCARPSGSMPARGRAPTWPSWRRAVRPRDRPHPGRRRHRGRARAHAAAPAGRGRSTPATRWVVPPACSARR